MLLDQKKEWTVCIDPIWLNFAVIMLRAGLKLNIQKTKIMTSDPITSEQIDEETMETVTDYFLRLQNHLQMVTAAMKLKDTCSLEEKL